MSTERETKLIIHANLAVGLLWLILVVEFSSDLALRIIYMMDLHPFVFYVIELIDTSIIGIELILAVFAFIMTAKLISKV